MRIPEENIMRYTKYPKEKLIEAVKESKSMSDVARWFGKNPVGGTITLVANNIKKHEIDTSHFTGQGHMKGKVSKRRRPPEDILKYDDSEFPRRQGGLIKRALLDLGIEEKCFACGITEWNGKEITLPVDHINGKYWDHRQENLRFLCPNCHSQTITFGNKKR